jgi:hypothetical protein
MATDDGFRVRVAWCEEFKKIRRVLDKALHES